MLPDILHLSKVIHDDLYTDCCICFLTNHPLSVYTEAAVAPSNVSATTTSSTAISVEWEGLPQCELVNGLIVKYRVVYRAETGGVQSTEQSGTWDSSSNVSLSGLTPSTNYFIQVAAVNEEGDVGQYSHTISVRTRLLCIDYSWQCVAAAVPVGAFLVVTVITIVLLTVFCYK